MNVKYIGEESLPVARLIAAAPELLEALKEVERRLRIVVEAPDAPGCEPCEKCLEYSSVALGITRAAIAKAEGGGR